MSSLMHKPTGSTIDAQAGNLRRNATANPAFKPEFRRSLRMHPVPAAVVAAVVLLLMIAFATMQKPLYYAESLIYIEPFSGKVLADGTTGNFDSTKYESSLAQQMLTAQRADILTTALATLPHQAWAAYGPTPKVAATVLQGQMKVARVSTSYQVSISLKGPNAGNTAAIVNAVTTAYLEAGRKDEISQADQRSQLLSEERSRIEQELATARAEQTRLGATLGVANPGAEGGGNPFDSQLDALRSQLVQARASHDQAAAQLAAISGGSGVHASGLTAAANDIIGNDPGLGSMKATINQRRAQLSSQMAGLTPGNPIYKQDQDELADLDKTLDSMTVQLRDRAARSLQDKLRTDLERSSDVEARLNGELARQSAAATMASPRLQRAQELAADVQRLTARYAIVDNALHSLQLETTGPGMAHLALAAAVPSAPEPTKKRLILMAALPFALLCGLGAAVFARKRDHRVYTAGDVDEVLGFGPIAILPARAEVAGDVLDEYYLRLAAGVEGAYRSGNARTFVITPVSAETDIAPLVQALDRKLVELGLGVVILEAGTIFEQEPTATAELDPSFDRHFEGIAPALFSRMKAEHDVILLESPALLISAQTEYVARCSDVTLLIAESSVTTRGELYQAGVLLQRLNVTGVGSVLEELQLRYADGTFAKGVRTLEGRSHPARRERPVAVQAEPAPVVAVEAVAVDELPVADEPPHISAEPVAPAWYPVHAVVTPEEPAAESFTEPAPEVQAEPFQSSDFVEREHPAPMALFDSIDPAAERRQRGSMFGASPTPDEEPAEPARGWFKRIFQRDAEPVFSIIPTDEKEDEQTAAPVMAARPAPYDATRYDLPLPVAPEPLRNLAAEPAELVAQVVEAPLPEPVEAAPVHVAPMVEAPVDAEPVVFTPPAVQPIAFEPMPARALPSRPLSFLELSQLNQPPPVEPVPPAPMPAPVPFQHFEAAVEPEPVALVHYTPEPEPTPIAAVAKPEAPAQPEADYTEPDYATQDYATQDYATPEPVADDWTPAPLNRWDPIPPLRPQEEPWRTSSGATRIAQQQPSREVWRGEDPVRIAPADRWVAAESIPAEAPPAESNDVVLTRRWGLLSRFQQGESFQSTQAARRQPEPEQYAQDFGQDYDPEYDRMRR